VPSNVLTISFYSTHRHNHFSTGVG